MKRAIVAFALAIGIVALSMGNIGCGDAPKATTKAPAPAPASGK